VNKAIEIRSKLLSRNVTAMVQRAIIEDKGSSSVRMSMSWQSYRFVVLIIALMAAYLFVIADDRYASSAMLKVQSTETAPQLSFAAGPAGLLGGGASDDSKLMLAYIQSTDMLRAVERKLDFRGHYANRDYDPYYRMGADLSFEDVHRYYKDVVRISIDAESGILDLEVQAFDDKFAAALTSAILEEAGRFLNSINKDIAEGEIAFFNQELEIAEAELKAAEDALLAFQNRVQEISPTASSEAFQLRINALESQISAAEAEVRSLKAFQSAESLEVGAAEANVRALQDQLEAEKSKLSDETRRSANDLTATEQRLLRKLTFQTERYQRTLSVIEQKRIASAQNIKHLVIVQSPMVAEEAKYPGRLYTLLSTLIILSVFYAILIMVIAAVQEHSDV